MHRIIKQNYFKGKIVKRLDESVRHLLTYLQDKCHDHLTKATKGKITRKNTKIYNNHQRAFKQKDKYVVQKMGENFIVSKNEESYIVKIKQGPCQYTSCGLIYKDCDICLHRISCICFENSIHFEMCIHCHLAMLHNLCNSAQEAENEIVQRLTKRWNNWKSQSILLFRTTMMFAMTFLMTFPMIRHCNLVWKDI